MTAALCTEVRTLMSRLGQPETLSDDEIALVLRALRMADKRRSEPLAPVVHLELVRPGKRRRRR
jgi:hypothetical protein